jgi:hypothetical protein
LRDAERCKKEFPVIHPGQDETRSTFNDGCSEGEEVPGYFIPSLSSLDFQSFALVLLFYFVHCISDKNLNDCYGRIM